jgi:hypothetical protein
MSPISQFPAASTGSEAVTYTSGTTAQRAASPTAGSTYYNTTLGELQIFQNGVWTALQLPAAPKAPTVVSLTDNGSEKAYGTNGSITITYTQNQEGGFAPNFIATSTPGSISQTSAIANPSTSNTITINGLTSNTSYTFALAGINVSGTGTSTTTDAITATTVPQVPQSYNFASVTGNSVTLNWTAGNTGGKAVTYRIKNLATNASVTTANTTYNFTGLSGSVSFEIYAVNANGDSLPLTTSSLTMGFYTRLSTVTSSTTYTVPAGTTKLAFTAIGSGANGSAGNTSNGGAGGRGGGGAIVYDVSVTAGDQFVISIPGSGGGATTVTKSGSAQLLSAGATVSVDAAQAGSNYATANPGTAGTAGNNGNGPTSGTSGGAGNSLTYPTAITNVAGNEAVNTGSGGGGGGGGGAYNEARVTVVNGPYTGYYRYYSYTYYTTSYYFLASSLNNPTSGGAAGGTLAGAGGAGGTGMFVSAGSIVSQTGQGSNGSTYGGGGGGSGGVSSGKSSVNAVGGTGGQGVVYIYGK